MNNLLAYLDRIQGRLLAAFGLILLGTLIIWWVSYDTVGEFGDVADRMSATNNATSDALRLQSSILEQIASGEHYLLTRDAGTLAEFDSLTTIVQALAESYEQGGSFTDDDRKNLTMLKTLHTEVVAAYGAAREDVMAGRMEDAVAKAEAVSPKT